VSQPLDPRRVNVCVDANALDPADDERDEQVERFQLLQSANVFRVIVPRGVRAELTNPHTPKPVRDGLLPEIFSLPTGHTSAETMLSLKLRAILQGNAQSGKHDADAGHLFEAAKYGGYFITHDGRILKKRRQLAAELPSSLQIVTLAEFLAIYDGFAAGG
jgi:hypothetical protein